MDDENWKEAVFYQISEAFVGRGIRTKKWKYAVHAPQLQDLGEISHEWSLEAFYEMVGKSGIGSDAYVELALFDLENDPYEKNNLVADHAYQKVREKLCKIMVDFMVEAGEEAPVVYPAGTVLEGKSGK